MYKLFDDFNTGLSNDVVKGEIVTIMNKNMKNIGPLFIIAGIVVAVLIKKEIIGAIIILFGVFINVIAHMIGTLVYVCPKCKTEFKKTNDKLILKTSFSFRGWSLLTCPKCKKTSFMKMKLVSKDEL